MPKCLKEYPFVILIAQLLADKDNLDPVGDKAAAGNNNLVADTVLAQAVCAAPKLPAGRMIVKAHGVWRSRHVPYALNGAFHIGSDFIHAGDDNDILWAMDERSDPVAIAINIDKLSVEGNGVRTHKIVITGCDFSEHFPLFIKSFSLKAVVNNAVRRFDGIDKPNFV